MSTSGWLAVVVVACLGAFVYLVVHEHYLAAIFPVVVAVCVRIDRDEESDEQKEEK